MRDIININDNWKFFMDGNETIVTLPHTWNNFDGQDGTNGYRRGKFVYRRTLSPIEKGNVLLEFEGVNSVCEVYIDDNLIGTHKGGYSHFRFDITQYIRKECELKVFVDNEDKADVYPSVADFTFWGGIYRNVNLIITGELCFSSDDFSSDGLYVTPYKKDDNWYLGIKALVNKSDSGATIRYSLSDKDGNKTASENAECKSGITRINCGKVHLWNGRKDPYLYSLKAEIVSADGIVSDCLTVKTGFREYYIDENEGFFLNGEHIKLHGLCRHQDRENMGNAITEKEHREDIDIILETGANALRLAHYQQDSFFYDLCDEKGLLVWAEVPVISRFSIKKQGNARQQLTELIKQNYNHPSIFCWGIENEITIGGIVDKKLCSSLEELNAIVKKTDKTRYSTCAQVSMLQSDSKLNNITDILGYNHYFGWYMDSCSGLGRWFDDFRLKNPQKKLCLSEYGAEAILKWQTECPEQGDYTEQYQCVFHEKYLEEINKRDWLWGSFLWNTFDFGCARRNEGGCRGRNNKGLVTYDRKIKKDSFYLYKASWSEEKMLHICGSRFIKRPVGETNVKVYSNLPEITLTVNDKAFTQKGNTVFVFENIPISLGKNNITAKAGDIAETLEIIGVEEAEKEYSLPMEQRSFVRNWFEEGSAKRADRLSADDSLADVLKNNEVKRIAVSQLGPKSAILFSPAAELLRPIKVKHAFKLLTKLGFSKDIISLAEGFLQTVEK